MSAVAGTTFLRTVIASKLQKKFLICMIRFLRVLVSTTLELTRVDAD